MIIVKKLRGISLSASVVIKNAAEPTTHRMTRVFLHASGTSRMLRLSPYISNSAAKAINTHLKNVNSANVTG